MGENSKIQWTDHTFNPWTGCTKVSPGCTNCYAEDLRKRFGKDEWGPGKQRVRTSEANWRKPLAWDKAAAEAGIRHRVFCASLADWLDPEAPIEWLADLLALIDATPHLDWLLLTKRPEYWRHRVDLAGNHASKSGRKLSWDWLRGTAPSNVWVGTTVEDQRRAGERIPQLLAIPARVRFLSMEPLLEAVDLWPALSVADSNGEMSGPRVKPDGSPEIDWVICGGESGRRARPFNIEWARSILRQCKEAGVACFVKQLGSLPLTDPYSGDRVYYYCDGCRAVEMRNVKTGERSNLADREAFARLQGISDSHGGDPSEWPADLRVREFPV